MNYKAFATTLGFLPKTNTVDTYIKTYVGGYSLDIDFKNGIINYGKKIKIVSKSSQNFFHSENFVVLECVNRLLEKGYKPENIILEKTWGAGHGTSGRLDICVTRDDGSEYLLIECKVHGKEFDKEFARMKKDGGQLFTYFKFSNKADLIMLYSSELNGKGIIYRNEIVKIEEEYRTGDVKDFYDKWNKLTKDNGVFDSWVRPYSYISKALTANSLISIKQEDSSFIFNRFLEILRHNIVSDKPNAFNKIFTLFLCKIYDEKVNEGTDNELDFQWKEGIDDDISFQLRLTDLYKNGMFEFLEKRVTDFSEKEFERKYNQLDENVRNLLLEEFKKIRLEKNNEFAIKEVYDEKSFKENAKVVKEVVELLQGYKIRYTQKQQYLSDFFEMLLTTGLKQESGQFFTPVPIAQFIIKSLPIDRMVEEKLKSGKRDDLLPYIIDYAAGSGHFLTESMHEIQRLLNHIDTKKLKSEARSFIEIWRIRHFDWALQYVYGIEKDYRLVKVGKVGCYLHGDGLANVIHSDGLADFNHSDYKGKLSITDVAFKKENKQFDIVISNPPYSVSSFKNASIDYYKEKDFELYSKLTDNSSEIECLFVERTKQLLKDEGIAGIILPSSILSNASIYTKAREIILQYFDIVAIAELGSNTFMATGTNTVTLFLRRRNNYESMNIKKSSDRFFDTFQDVTINGIERPVLSYINHVWTGISFEDYLSLLQKQPNSVIQDHELFKEYEKKVIFKCPSVQAGLLSIIEREKEKLYYYILSFNQKVVIVKSGERDAEKRFLGYEFSNRRGSEGIHPIQRGKNIEDCTQLFDPQVFDNPERASTYIYKAFNGDYDFPISVSLANNIYRHNLVDMLNFDRADFEKIISLNIKKKITIESKWKIVKLNQLASIVRGASPRPIKEYITENEGVNWIKIGDVKPNSKYITETKEKITAEGAEKSRRVNKGDFILSNSMSFGRPYIMDTDGCIHDGWLLLSEFAKDLDKDYLYNILSHTMVQEQFAKAASGGTSVDNLNIEKVSHVKIPFPPKEIQTKIVSEIENVEIREKLISKEIGELNLKIRDIYISCKPRYKEVILSNEIEIIGGGTPSTNNPKYWDGDIPWLSIVDFKNDNRFVETTEKKITEDGLKNSSTKYLNIGDIIISARGTVGALAQLKYPMTFNQSCYGIQAKNNLLTDYLYFALKFEIEQFKNNSYGAIFDTITIRTFNLIKIPLPPLSVQKKIISEIEIIENKIIALKQELLTIPFDKDNIIAKYLT